MSRGGEASRGPGESLLGGKSLPGREGLPAAPPGMGEGDDPTAGRRDSGQRRAWGEIDRPSASAKACGWTRGAMIPWEGPEQDGR